MKKDEFELIKKLIHSDNGLIDSRSCMAELKSKFFSVDELTLKSIYSQEYLRKMKFSHGQHQAHSEKYYERYLNFRDTSDYILIEMSYELELAPTLLARLILEKHYERKAVYDENIRASRGSITKLMKDTTLIDDKNLAMHVYMCVLKDDQYGPLSDTINHSLGQQFEYKLSRLLKEKNIAFQDEEQMRVLGLDKTPDVKLELPISVNGFIIHWIESKALFGSDEWHENIVSKQLSTYWNRYGPGMVIYWFDFVDSIQYSNSKQLLVCRDLPEEMTVMNPSLLFQPLQGD